MAKQNKVELSIVDTAGTGWLEQFDTVDDAKESVDTIVSDGSIDAPYIDTITLIVNGDATEELYRYEPDDEDDEDSENG